MERKSEAITAKSADSGLLVHQARALFGARVTVLVASFLATLGGYLFFHSFPFIPFLLVAGSIVVLLALTIGVWWKLSTKDGKILHYRLHIILDTAIVSGIVYLTGGPGSPFLFLYLAVVMGAAVTRSRPVALTVAAICSLSYVALAVSMLNKWLPPLDASMPVYPPSSGLILQVIGLTSGTILVAVATSYLSRKLTASVEASSRTLSEVAKRQEIFIRDFPDPVITTDLEFKITGGNAKVIELLGLQGEEIKGRNLQALLLDYDCKFDGNFDKDLPELSLTNPVTNSRLLVQCHKRPFYNEGGIQTGYLFVLQDLTKLRSAEEQLELQERMARLLARSEPTDHELSRLKGELTDFVGDSPLMQQVFKLIKRVAPSDATVLVSGESGTGKELVARALHKASARSAMPFVPVNCGAIPETLIESELFGHKKGSYTGAISDHVGLFQQAEGGTLFLDEIGELPLAMQSKLLRAIQERSIRQIGGSKDTPINVRIVAATNKNLKREVEVGKFREDLYYRLNVIHVVLPPLRERREDIPLLVNSILKDLVRGGKTPLVPPQTMQLLVNYPYPGNVRELENVLERAHVLGGDVLLPEHLPDTLQHTPQGRRGASKPETQILIADDIEFPVHLDDILQGLERKYLEAALRQTNGAKKKAADLLGINFRSFRYRLQKFGMGDQEGDMQ